MASNNNLYEILKVKFPGKDIDNDPEERKRYRFYLRKNGAFYYDKNKANIEAKKAAMVHSLKIACESTWRHLRLQEMREPTHLMATDTDERPSSSLSSIDSRIPNPAASQSAELLMPDTEALNTSESQMLEMPESEILEMSESLIEMPESQDEQTEIEAEPPMAVNSEELVDIAGQIRSESQMPVLITSSACDGILSSESFGPSSGTLPDSLRIQPIATSTQDEENN